MIKRKRARRWAEMTTKQLARATAEFDREFVADTFHPMTAEDRKRWARIKRKRGRPKVGRGAKVIAVSLERELLAKCDRLAKRKRVSRASLITRGLKAVLAAEETG